MRLDKLFVLLLADPTGFMITKIALQCSFLTFFLREAKQSEDACFNDIHSHLFVELTAVLIFHLIDTHHVRYL